MNLNDYRLNAYNKVKSSTEENKEDETDKQDVTNFSKQIRHSSKPGTEPLIKMPVFEKINRMDLGTDKKQKTMYDFQSAMNRATSAQPYNSRTQNDDNYNTKKNLVTPGTVPDAKDLKAQEEARFAAKNGAWFAKKNTTQEEVKEAASKLTSGGLIMVPGEKKDGEKESIYRRVAKFLVVIGMDEASKILPHLTEEQTEKIIPEIATIRYVSPEEAKEVLDEFKSLLNKAQEAGGVDTARKLLTKVYGAEKADQVLNKVVKHPDGKPFDYLSDANAERIGILLDGESPSVQALVLSQINPQKAANVIKRMDTENKTEVIMRLAKMKPVSPEIIENLNKSLKEKMMTQNTENSQNLDGRTALAQILKRMDPSAEYSIIANLSAENPELGADLRRRLFTEEDVIACDDRYMQKKLHDMTDSDLVILLRGKSDGFRQKIFSNISKNRAQVIYDEELLKEHVLKSDSDRITSQLYADLRRAWEVGELMVEGRDEEYI